MHANRWIRPFAWMTGLVTLGFAFSLFAATPCQSTRDCAASQVCAGAVCLHACDADSDCGVDQACDPDGFCLPDSCEADSDCQRADFICRSEGSVCVPAACRYDSDCLKGEICDKGGCVQDPTLYVQGGTSTCQSGSACAGLLAAGLLAALAWRRRRV